MRDFIVRALSRALCELVPRRRPGRHSATHLTPAPEPVIPVSPWSRPWTSPSKEEVAEIFRRQAEEWARMEEAELQRERRRAAELATLGIDHPYTYPGAHFPRDAFGETTGVVA
ncbi:hypothetical protein ACSCBZ_37045 [Streptomyces niveiscabiei]|uniref:hypothetical protein n=2 Tax=Streptomyces niveiscabiei TaxID=164115 RepID=UPI003EB770A5